MFPLTGKNVVVIGGSRGVGRQIVAAAHGSGASVLAVARQGPPLARLAGEFAGCAILALDAAEDAAVFGLHRGFFGGEGFVGNYVRVGEMGKIHV